MTRKTMSKFQRNSLKQSVFLLLLLSLTACSTIERFTDSKREVNYSNNASVKLLEFPPDLTKPEFDSEFSLPQGRTVSAVAMQNGASGYIGNASSASVSQQGTRVPVRKLSDIRSQNGQTVLQINDTYSRSLILTDIMLTRMAFSITRRDTARGVYDVVYNGSDIKSEKKEGFLSGTFSYLKSLTRAGSDNNKILAKGKSYQVHIRNQAGVPLVHFTGANGQALSPVAHTKIITLLNDEFNRSTPTAGRTTNAPALKNGNSGVVSAPARTVSPSAPQQGSRLTTGPLASIRSFNGQTVLQVNDTYKRALILTDIMLQRMSFLITRRDTAHGVYNVDYNGKDVSTKAEGGFLSNSYNYLKRLTRTDKNKVLVKGKSYQVHITKPSGAPLVHFTDANGQALAQATQTKIITLLNNEFNR
jgi:uncharacterized lipoprotein